MKKKIPNILTMLRILLVIMLIIFVTIPNKNMKIISGNFSVESLIILIIFLTASFTDFLDGFLARKWQVVSNVGKLLDPIADKMLITTTLLIYLSYDKIPFIIVALLVGRDILVDGLRMLALEKQIVIAASILGKVKTICQIAALTVVIIDFNEKISLTLLIVATAVSLLGMVEYYYRNFQRINNGHGNAIN